MIYTIGEMAKVLELPTSTLRFYEKKGILPFIERSNGGIRMFTDKDLECLRIVECLKKSGMQLKEIESFIKMTMQGDETINDRLKLFENRKFEVEKQIDELQTTLQTLKYKCWYYSTAKEAGTTAALEKLTIDEIPPEFREIKESLEKK